MVALSRFCCGTEGGAPRLARGAGVAVPGEGLTVLVLGKGGPEDLAGHGDWSYRGSQGSRPTSVPGETDSYCFSPRYFTQTPLLII